ncbi:zinc ABC transporter substrate-binding protein AztC [Mesorhizobium sp. ZMM04-5]|uniref:Zinc ABC transporter substrate-binding protein AztC n=1 Tax=Mesorhizobium marinum TaxID=3228790 RepID=A0ABV3QWY0_9HYPH
MTVLPRLALAMSVITLSALPAAAEPLKVVASFSIIGDLARNVGGDRIALTTLVGPDGDAHVYEPRPADAVAMGKADVVLVNGLHFEGFLKRLVEASGTTAPVVELTKGGEMLKNAEEGHEGDNHAHEGHHHHGEFDPHAWQSVHNAEVYVKNIADAFCAADTAGCASYRANAEAYGAKLKALDAEIKAAIAGIPEEKRTIITSHDAFGYFQHEYGLTFLAPEGVSTEAEASAADVAALIKQIKGDRASAIFVENITNQRLIEQISSETGLKIGGTLYSDALSGADGPAPTYIDMMKFNTKTISGAILGS